MRTKKKATRKKKIIAKKKQQNQKMEHAQRRVLISYKNKEEL